MSCGSRVPGAPGRETTAVQIGRDIRATSGEAGSLASLVRLCLGGRKEPVPQVLSYWRLRSVASPLFQSGVHPTWPTSSKNLAARGGWSNFPGRHATTCARPPRPRRPLVHAVGGPAGVGLAPQDPRNPWGSGVGLWGPGNCWGTGDFRSPISQCWVHRFTGPLPTDTGTPAQRRWVRWVGAPRRATFGTTRYSCPLTRGPPPPPPASRFPAQCPPAGASAALAGPGGPRRPPRGAAWRPTR